MCRKKIYLSAYGTILSFFLFCFLLNPLALFGANGPNRARGYSVIGELKTMVLNNGILSGAGDASLPAPEGYYHNYQYLPSVSFILGVAGCDSLGNPYPWALRPAVDSLTGLPIYPDTIVYWGPTVSESWFDLTFDRHLTDWEADSLSSLYLFGNATANDLRFVTGNRWIMPEDPFPVLAHSNYPVTWPGGAAVTWPGFWGWDENGQPIPGQFFSDQDIYWEMDDRTATRDVDPTQGYPTGIRVKAMTSVFSEIPGGFIILRFRLINQSPYDYRDIYTGFYFNADVYHRTGDGSLSGRTNNDDMMRYSWKSKLAYIWDLDDNSTGVTHLAYTGIGYLETPPAGRPVDLNADGQPDVLPGEPTGVTGWHWFDWYFRPGSNDGGVQGPFSGSGDWPVSPDKEAIQYKLMAGDTSAAGSPPYWHQRNRQHFFHAAPNGFLNPRFDSNGAIQQDYPNGLDCVFIISNGPFNLNSGDSTEVTAVLLAAPDSSELIHSAKVARSIYEKGIIHKAVRLISGNGGEVFTGPSTLTWMVDPNYPHPVDSVDIYLGNGTEPEWFLLASEVPNTGSYTFSTDSLPDGAFYRAAVISHTGASFAYGVSNNYFLINNPGINVPPELMVLEPQPGDTLSGMAPVKWIARDADFDSLWYSLDVKSDGIWTKIIDNQPNTNFVQLNTNQLFNGKISLKITIKDNTHQVQTIINDIYIHNTETLVSDTVFHHVNGYGNGRLQLNLLNPAEVTGHLYRLEFDTVPPVNATEITAHLYDVSLQTYIIQNIPCKNQLANVIFDGLSLKMLNYYPARIDSAYWKSGASTWNIYVNPFQANPSDYEIVFGGAGLDTVYHVTNGTPLFPVPFRVFNISFAPNTKLKLVGLDLPPLGQFNPGDKIYLMEDIYAGYPVSPPQRTYQLGFDWDSSSVAPQPGDVFRFTTVGYFWEQDTILFRSPTWMDLGGTDNRTVKEFFLYPNYPNPFNPTTIIKFTLPRAAKVRLEIFNILGQRVRTLVNGKLPAGVRQVLWDGTDDAGQSVASGIYFYRITITNPLSRQLWQQTRKMVYLK